MTGEDMGEVIADLGEYRGRRRRTAERRAIAAKLRALPIPDLVASWCARNGGDHAALAAFLIELANDRGVS
jgi:hypothetical protein